MKTRLLLAQVAFIMETTVREELSDVPEELRARRSWTILTPQLTSKPLCTAPPPPLTCPPHRLKKDSSPGEPRRPE